MPYTDIEDRREASRRHYRGNRQAIIDRGVAYKRVARPRNRAYVEAIKVAAVCSDCGVDHPSWRLQFDHVGNDKVEAIAQMVENASSLAMIQTEIDKCEIVCANCHADRTHARKQAPIL